MRIDVHAHVWSEEYLGTLAGFGSTSTGVHRGMAAGTTSDELQVRPSVFDCDKRHQGTTRA